MDAKHRVASTIENWIALMGGGVESYLGKTGICERPRGAGGAGSGGGGDLMQLVRYEAMRAAIAAAASVDEAKDIADKATALAAYARQSKDPELERQVAEIRLRAKRRIGELSAALDRGAGRPSEIILPTHGKNFKASALAAANLSTSEANRCELSTDRIQARSRRC